MFAAVLITLYSLSAVGYFLLMLHDRDFRVRFSFAILSCFAVLWPAVSVLLVWSFIAAGVEDGRRSRRP